MHLQQDTSSLVYLQNDNFVTGKPTAKKWFMLNLTKHHVMEAITFVVLDPHNQDLKKDSLGKVIIVSPQIFLLSVYIILRIFVALVSTFNERRLVQ